jgi:hypothetical protein
VSRRVADLLWEMLVKGFTLSFAKQVLSGRMDSVITTIERNVGLV